ncbi:RRP12-like protein, partial [Araneus ventricosus]
MAYRATPLENGFSPSELLMGRRINTTLPIAMTQLQPYSVNKKVLEAKEERRIEGQKTNYDKHHSVRNLDELDPGQSVWITDRRVTGKVLQKTPYPRSYLVQSGRRVYRRNRKHLIPSPDFHPEPEPEDDSDVTGYQHSPADADPGCPPLMSSPQSPKTYPERASSSTEVSPDPYLVTLCGFKALQGLFDSDHKNLPADLNARIITALYDYQPNMKSSDCLICWIQLMERALINLYSLDEKLCIAHLPQFFSAAVKCWLNESEEVMLTVSITLENIVQNCFKTVNGDHMKKAVHKMFHSVEEALGYQYHKSWGHVLSVLAAFFETVGKHYKDIMMK